MKQTTSNKMLQYSVAAASFLSLSNQAQAAIVYTEVDPDEVIVNSSYSIDMNGDGFAELDIRQYMFSFTSSTYGTFISSNFVNANLYGGGGAEFARAGTAGGFLARALSSGTVIGSTSLLFDFYAYFGRITSFVFNTPYYTLSFSSSVGFWSGLTDRFVGVKFQISGADHFGWIRCDVAPAYGSVTVKSFAYEDTPNFPIVAGDTLGVGAVFADVVSSLSISDIDNFTDGRDLGVDFTPAADESTVGEYRLMIVKSADAATFTLSNALLVSSAYYLSYTPSGTAISTDMGINGRDANGMFIEEGIPYKAFVLSIADGTVANVSSLSAPSNEVTLSTFSAPASVATGVSAIDNSDFADGRDILVGWNPAADETTLTDYRVVIAKEAAAAAVDAPFAAALFGDQVKSVTPTGGPISTTLGINFQDTDGDLIVEGQPYVAFVVSMPDGVNATLASLATPSAAFTLNTASGLNEDLTAALEILVVDRSLLFQGMESAVDVTVSDLDGRLLAQKTLRGAGRIFSHNWSAGELVIVTVQEIEGGAAFSRKVLIR